MNVNNPIQMNDWEIKKFLKIVLAIQFVIWGVMGLDAIGLQIPILRQFIGFIYLTFIPGILILRILRLHKIGNIETILYAVGLSIATLMFTGLFMNTVYPLFGISGAISLTPLIITISAVVVVLCVLGYVRDKDFSDPSYIDIKDLLSPPALFLCLIPFLSIFGTYLVNFHHNNILLMFLIVIIALIVVLIAFDKFIPKNLYPLAVFVITISLLYHKSLISMYPTGWDIHTEYYLSNLVITNSHWNPVIPSTANAMLSIVMLAPAYSNICSMTLTWVFKIIYPLLFSLVPLGLYHVFQKQTDDKIAFLSCFFFVSLFTFYCEMLALARQAIAELFFVLLILLMIDKNMDKIKRSFFFIVFGISLAVSHYGLSYIYMFCLIFTWLILVSMENPAIQKLRDNFHSSRKREEPAGNPISLKVGDKTINSTFVLLFLVFALTWYMYLSSSYAFNAIVHMGDHIYNSLSNLFSLETRDQEVLLFLGKGSMVSFEREVHRFLFHLTQLFIIVGIYELIVKHKQMKFEEEYFSMILISVVIIFMCIILPFFASHLHMTRIYHITLFFLSPFCILGGRTIFRGTLKLFKYTALSTANKSMYAKLLLIILIPYFMFNTGFVYVVTGDIPASISLDLERMKISSDEKVNLGLAGSYICEQEAISAYWLSKNKDNVSTVYADTYAITHVLTSCGLMPPLTGRTHSLLPTTKIKDDAYIYLSHLNVINGLVAFPPSQTHTEGSAYAITEISPRLDKGNKVYSNGGSNVYK